MFKNYRFLLFAAVVLAIAAALISVRAVQNYAGSTKVLIAARDIQNDQVVAPGDLAWAEIPRGALYGDTAVDPQKTEGLVARGFIPGGTVIRQSMLAVAAQASLTGKLSELSKGGEEYYAVGIPGSIFTSVAGELRTGDHVDIYISSSPVPLAANSPVLVGVPPAQGNSPANTQGIVVAVKGSERDALLPELAQGNQKGQLVVVLKGRG